MSGKLRGPRLEAEVERARTEGNWKRLSELVPSIRSSKSGVEDTLSADVIEAEVELETFLEAHELLRPHVDHLAKLRNAASLLQDALQEKKTASGAILEAHLLFAKLNYICAQYDKALKEIEQSGMERGTTPFLTLRVLRLVAEAYAVKGLCQETQECGERLGTLPSQKTLYCFEKSAELAMSYVAELEKTISSSNSKGSTPTLSSMGTSSSKLLEREKIGDILECCLERVAVLRLKDPKPTPVASASAEKKINVEGLEWYRRIIACLGDKSTGERLQQKLSRQLAEVLMRLVTPEGRQASQAVNDKSLNLSFYTGSHRAYFSPNSRTEEILLLLMISEVLATREVVLSRSDELSSSCMATVTNAKAVYSLLTLVLSSLRQFHLLSTIYERAMKFANQDAYLWQQFGVSMLARGRWLRAARIFDQAISVEGSEAPLLHCLSAQLHIEHLAQYDIAMDHANKASSLCDVHDMGYLKARSQLLAAIAHGCSAQLETSWEERRRLLQKTVGMLECCVNADPHDYLALYYSALYHAIARDGDAARDRCLRSLHLNPEQPSALMLLALVFTAEGDLKGALELVSNALQDFPVNYGLLVLKLHIETKFGRMDESMDTCVELLHCWRRQDPMAPNNDEERAQWTLSASEGNALLKDAMHRSGATSSVGRELNAGTPLYAGGGLGFSIAAGVMSTTASQSGMDMSDSGVAASEAGGQSTASECGAGMLGAGASGMTASWTRFRQQANMWLALSELFLAEGRVNDVTPCVEQAIALFPSTHQALYLKGRLYMIRAEKANEEAIAGKLRAEAKASFLSALALCPSHTASMSHLAALYLNSGNVVMAEQMYKELVRVDPLCGEWWQQLGCCAMRRAHAARASECFAAASQLHGAMPLLPYSMIPLVFPSSF